MAMADGITIPAPGTTPLTGGLNYEDYRRKITEAAARTRDVPGAADLTGVKKAATTIKTTMGGIGQTYGGLAETAIKDFETQQTDIQKRAERAASALEMVGESTLKGVQAMEVLQGQIRTQVQNAADNWGAAAEKADEYVQASRGRVGEVLKKLDDLNRDMVTTRDFSKAHAMQASVQAVTGSMKDEERNILQNYGSESKEYEQFQKSKLSALATVQSNIHTSYAQLEEQQKSTYLNAVSDAYTKSNMYVGFQEQQHVDMLKFKQEGENSYALRGAELDVSIEQMKMAGMENLANWVIETPTFTLDTTPLVTMVADLGTIAMNQYIAYKTMKRTTKGGSAGASAALGALTGAGTGFLMGGPIGAVAGGLVGGTKGYLQSKV